MKILKTLFKQKPSYNWVYDARAFQIKDEVLVLEQDLEIKLPQQLKGKQLTFKTKNTNMTKNTKWYFWLCINQLAF